MPDTHVVGLLGFVTVPIVIFITCRLDDCMTVLLQPIYFYFGRECNFLSEVYQNSKVCFTEISNSLQYRHTHQRHSITS